VLTDFAASSSLTGEPLFEALLLILSRVLS
jgi:hypothetical protein